MLNIALLFQVFSPLKRRDGAILFSAYLVLYLPLQSPPPKSSQKWAKIPPDQNTEIINSKKDNFLFFCDNRVEPRCKAQRSLEWEGVQCLQCVFVLPLWTFIYLSSSVIYLICLLAWDSQNMFMYNASMACRWWEMLSQITKCILTTAFWRLLNKDIATENSGAMG